MPEKERDCLMQEHARAGAIACDDRFTKEYKEEHLRIHGKAYNG